MLCVEVGEDIVLGEYTVHKVVFSLAACSLPGLIEVALEVVRDKADSLLHLVDNVSFVSHVEMAEREEAGHVVCQELAADVESPDGRLERAAAEDGSDGRVRVARVDDEKDLRGSVGYGWRFLRGVEEVLHIVVSVESRS